MDYIVITPVYNEEKLLSNYIDSIVNQATKPVKLILVDDNSTDDSAEIIKAYCRKHNWIVYIHHPAARKKSQGAKVIRAFNYGLENISLKEVDFISKIDADLELPLNYFKEVINVFSSKPEVGITGGYILEKKKGNWCRINQANYHIRGALKSYRVESFNQIEGLMPVLGWDGLDEMKIFYNGWESHNIEIGVKHFRSASIDYNQRCLAFKKGYSNYKSGSNLFLAIIRALVRIKKKPYLIYSIYYLTGYTKAWLSNEDKHVSKGLEKYINRFHINRIFKFDI